MKTSQRERLEKELKGLLKQLDEEGLIFLLKQANIIIHNMQVDKLNKEIVEFEKKKSKKNKSTTKTTQRSNTVVTIEEAGNRKSFIITLNNYRKIFSLDEMHKIVVICHAALNKNDASQRLFRWFSQNRRDVLSDAKLGNSANPILQNLYNVIIKTYKAPG